jgi:hypothetical protein
LDSSQRLTIRHLINSAAQLPEFIKRHHEKRTYTLACGVVKHFLGEEWLRNNTGPVYKERGFLTPTLTDDGVLDQIQLFRLVDLAELLFNLQNIEGVEKCIDQLKTAKQIETTIAELDVARMLYINDHYFWFNPPGGVEGSDFDFLLMYPNGMLAAIEAKCNIESETFNPATIRNALLKAKKQLPTNIPGIIFVKIHGKVFAQPDFQKDSQRVAIAFLRNTERVASVKFYCEQITYVNGIIGQTHAFWEITNPNHRFSHDMDWNLLTNWRPQQQKWNMLPGKWVKLMYFPLREPPR